MRWIKRLLIVVLLLGAGIAAYWYLVIRPKAEGIRRELHAAERAYLQGLVETLSTSADVLAKPALAVFLSEKQINAALGGLVGHEFPILEGQDLNVAVRSVKTAFRDGFPLVVLDTSLGKTGLPARLDVQLTAALMAQTPKDHPTILYLTLRPVEVGTALQARDRRFSLPDLVNSGVLIALDKWAERLPRTVIPLATTLSLAVPATSQGFSIPTQSGALNGVIDIPAIGTNVPLAISEILPLKHGLLLLIDISGEARGKPLIVSVPPGTSLSETDGELMAQIEGLRQRVDPLLHRWRLPETDLKVAARPALLKSFVDAVNGLPADSRIVRYRNLSQTGQMYRAAEPVCGWYAELAGGNSLNADLALSNLTAEWGADAIRVAGDLAFHLKAQLHGHVNPPPGPCIVKNMLGIPGLDFAGGLKCHCGVGGGIPANDVPFEGKLAQRVTLEVRPTPGPGSWMAYTLRLASPTEIPITIDVRKGPFYANFVISFRTPTDMSLPGGASSIFQDAGVVEIAKPVPFRKSFTFRMGPAGSSFSAEEYAVSAKIDLEWAETSAREEPRKADATPPDGELARLSRN